jgi:hypothetical protein
MRALRWLLLGGLVAVAGCGSANALVLVELTIDVGVPHADSVSLSVPAAPSVKAISIQLDDQKRSQVIHVGYYMPGIGSVTIEAQALAGGCVVGQGTASSATAARAGETSGPVQVVVTKKADATCTDGGSGLTEGGTDVRDTNPPVDGTDGGTDVRDTNPQVDGPDGATDVRDANPQVDGTDGGTDVRDATPPHDGAPPIPPPRLIAPLSTATVTRRQPTLHWVLAGGSDGAHVQICFDRDCTREVTSFDVGNNATSGMPPAELPTGGDVQVFFWRAYGRSGTTTGDTPSSTWEMFVGKQSAPVDTSWGSTLDVNGDGLADVVVGADNGDGVSGMAFVYTGSTSITSGATIMAPAPSASMTGHFGFSVSSAGDVNGDGFGDLIIGRLGGGNVNVYLGSRSGLSSTPTMLTRPAGSGQFGYAVASAGDVNGDGYADVIVGDIGGHAYIYMGGPSGPTDGSLLTTLTGPNDFGTSVSSAGDVDGDGLADVVVGAENARAAYVYRGSATTFNTTPFATASSTVGKFGWSVAGAGDFDGDGLSDVVIGDQQGKAYLYRGATISGTPQPTVTFFGTGLFGNTVAGAGDVNGDGLADVIIGAFAFSTPGMAFIYGGTTGTTANPLATLNLNLASFASSVASAGDVNGDGYVDLIVGAGFDATPPGAGKAYLFLGPVFDENHVVTLTGNIADASFGIMVF